jgi:eukaryotic-like serine/threonine-protein kinase
MIEQRTKLEESRSRRKKRRRIIWLSIAGALVLFILVYSLMSFTDIFIGGAQKTVDSSPPAGDWSMFRRDLSRTGVSDVAQTAPAGKIKWTFAAGDVIHSSPAVVDGIVYFGSRDRHFYAVDAQTGTLVWSFPTGSWVESSPVVVGGVVYFGCNDAKIYALDAKTGTKIWDFTAVYAIRSSPAIADGVLYIGTDDHHVYALDAATGKLKWRKSTDNLVISAPAVANGIVAVGCSDGVFYTFNAGNGQPRLQYDALAAINGSPAIRNGVAYFVDIGGTFTAMDISGKNWVWENKLKQYWNAAFLYGIAPRPPIPSGFLWSVPLAFVPGTASSVALSGDFAYMGLGNSVISVNLVTKKMAWQLKTTAMVNSSPAILDDVLYIGGNDGLLYAINKTTGEKLWDINFGAAITSSPAVAGGMLYIGCDDGKLYAIE